MLLAQILKHLYPKFVDIHNYPPRNSTALKLDNWQTLNRKVLQKLGLSQSNESLDRLAKGVPGAIEHLLYQIMIQSNMDLQRNKIPTNDNNIDDDESESFLDSHPANTIHTSLFFRYNDSER